MRHKKGNQSDRKSRRTLYRILSKYMIGIAALVIGFFVLAVLLIGGFRNPGADMTEQLSLQMEFFQDTMENYWEQLSAGGIDLSGELTQVLEESGAEDEKTVLETELLRELIPAVSRNACSGGFVVLTEGSGGGQTGSLPCVYIRRSGSRTSDEDLLLYRGIAAAGKAAGLTLHNKWKAEVQEGQFPALAALEAAQGLPKEKQYRVTGLFDLPGTDEQVWVLTVPLIGEEGEVCGFCGFEISRRYFRAAQQVPTQMKHLMCLAAPAEEAGILHAGQSLDCGRGYVPPEGDFRVKKGRAKILTVRNDTLSYVGLGKPISLSYGKNDCELLVLIPKREYDSAIFLNLLKLGIVAFLLLFFTVFCCTRLSRRYVSPILASLRMLQQEEYGPAEDSPHEFRELTAHLKEKEEKQRAERERMEARRQDAETEANRLAYSRKSEIDPLLYEHFVAGLATLTPTEQKIYDLYLAGMGTKEVMEAMKIRESTLRYHNKNLYSKLGVNSRKQLVLYGLVEKKTKT